MAHLVQILFLHTVSRGFREEGDLSKNVHQIVSMSGLELRCVRVGPQLPRCRVEIGLLYLDVV